ncbi:MAG: hypothetical protein EOM62_19145 [Bacteroidia bacterium]|nr:hypothetical protein [Bacteroidia bacterium]
MFKRHEISIAEIQEQSFEIIAKCNGMIYSRRKCCSDFPMTVGTEFYVSLIFSDFARAEGDFNLLTAKMSKRLNEGEIMPAGTGVYRKMQDSIRGTGQLTGCPYTFF